MNTTTQVQENNAIITLTPRATAHIRKMLQKHPQALGIRLGVKESGCSGKAYTIDFATEISATQDLVQEFDDVKMIIDKASIRYLQGTKLDCVTEGVNQILKFINPNATNECGCGESFQIKDSA